jgi:plastocyanin
MQKGITITIVLIAVVLIVGGFLLFSNKSPSTQNTGSSGLYGNPSGASSGTPDTGASNPITNPGTEGTTPQTRNIDISGFAFNPSTLTINAGDTVIWTNKDSAPHTVTSDSGSELKSSTLSAGSGSYSHTFTTAGTYAYHCNIHTMMKGTIVVQ